MEVLRVPLITLNHPRLYRITLPYDTIARDAKRAGYRGEHAGTMVDPEVSPQHTCLCVESFQYAQARPPGEEGHTAMIARLLAHIPPDSRCEASSSEPLPTEQSRVAVPITVDYINSTWGKKNNSQASSDLKFDTQAWVGTLGAARSDLF